MVKKRRQLAKVRNRIFYSDEIPGDETNYNWPVRYDLNSGSLGISQAGAIGTNGVRVNAIERVLLTPDQVAALLDFLRAHQRPIRGNWRNKLSRRFIIPAIEGQSLINRRKESRPHDPA